MCKEIIKCSGQTWQAYQRGPKGAKMINLSVFDNLGPSGPFLIILNKKLIFCFGAPLPNHTLAFWGKKNHFCLKWSKRVQMSPKGVPNGQKHFG